MKKITIGIPCYNEEENIELMYEAVTEQMLLLPEYDYEILFADNDSKDNSQNILRELAQKDSHVKVVLNQTNFGPDRSVVNCFRNASGDAYIGIPCDFQEPPEMIPTFVKEWENGHDIVWGQKSTSGESAIKLACRKLYYSIIDFMSDYPQIKMTTGFGIMDRKVLDTLLITQKQDPEFSTRNLVCEYGFDIELIPYEQRERARGTSSYNMAKYYDFAITSLCNTSIKPLRLMTIMGISVSVVCFIVAIFYLVYKLLNWNSFNLGMAPVLIGLFFVAGVQLFCIGILGEYIAVLIRRVTNRPLVIEKEKLNFDKGDEKSKI